MTSRTTPAQRPVAMLPLDVTDELSITNAVREVLGRRGRIDVLVNDDPAVMASAMIPVATTRKPRLRTPAGKRARQVPVARRLAPESAFDKQIRPLNGLPARS